MEIEQIAHLISYENQPRSLKQRCLLGHKISFLAIDLGGILSWHLFISMSSVHYATIFSHLKLQAKKAVVSLNCSSFVYSLFFFLPKMLSVRLSYPKNWNTSPPSICCGYFFINFDWWTLFFGEHLWFKNSDFSLA